MAEKNKKTFKMPHTFVIMMVIILFATLLTWIIPAGQYVRVENADGVKVDRKSTRLNSSHSRASRMPSSA